MRSRPQPPWCSCRSRACIGCHGNCSAAVVIAQPADRVPRSSVFLGSVRSRSEAGHLAASSMPRVRQDSEAVDVNHGKVFYPSLERRRGRDGPARARPIRWAGHERATPAAGGDCGEHRLRMASSWPLPSSASCRWNAESATVQSRTSSEPPPFRGRRPNRPRVRSRERKMIPLRPFPAHARGWTRGGQEMA